MELNPELTPLVQECCQKQQWGRLSDLLAWMKIQVGGGLAHNFTGCAERIPQDTQNGVGLGAVLLEVLENHLTRRRF